MANNLTLESKIKIAIMAVVQVNGDIWFNMLYNDNETEIARSRRKLLRKVKRYLVENYDLANNNLNDNVILAMLRNDEDIFSLFALNF